MSDQRYRRRFTRTERTLHWTHATAFLSLTATGLILYVPSLAAAVGRRPLVKEVHLLTALGWLLAFVLVVAVGNQAALRCTLREIETIDRDDRRWLAGRKAPQGRFNAGQKVNAILTAAVTVLFGASGVLLWLGERDHRFILGGTVVLHDALMYASLLLLSGHLYLALIHPTTRHALRGMTRGDVRADWAAKHHPKWGNELESE
jgi:formate dehydrogenase subunit gamma